MDKVIRCVYKNACMTMMEALEIICQTKLVPSSRATSSDGNSAQSRQLLQTENVAVGPNAHVAHPIAGIIFASHLNIMREMRVIK